MFSNNFNLPFLDGTRNRNIVQISIESHCISRIAHPFNKANKSSRSIEIFNTNQKSNKCVNQRNGKYEHLNILHEATGQLKWSRRRRNPFTDLFIPNAHIDRRTWNNQLFVWPKARETASVAPEFQMMHFQFICLISILILC